MTPRGRLLFIFLDGVGLGEGDPAHNPFLVARLPTLRGLLGGRLPTLGDPRVQGADAVSFPVDATMGIAGTPQSGTGQAALLTGRNAARLFGRHFGPWTPVALRPLVERDNVLSQALAAGRTAASRTLTLEAGRARRTGAAWRGHRWRPGQPGFSTGTRSTWATVGLYRARS